MVIALKYIDFIDAMRLWRDGDQNVWFHGSEGEVKILFGAKESEVKIKDLEVSDAYSLFELTSGLWTAE